MIPMFFALMLYYYLMGKTKITFGECVVVGSFIAGNRENILEYKNVILSQWVFLIT